MQRTLERAGFGAAFIECYLADPRHPWPYREKAGKWRSLAITAVSLVPLVMALLGRDGLIALTGEQGATMITLAFVLIVPAWWIGMFVLKSWFERTRRDTPEAAIESRAFAYIRDLAEGSSPDRPAPELLHLAQRLKAVPEPDQIRYLVEALGFHYKPTSAMTWYQLGLILAIITALGLAIWWSAPGSEI